MKNADKAAQYVEDVLSGKEPACRWVRLAVERHVADMKRVGDHAWRYVYEPARGERPCKVIEQLPHTKGKWAAKKEKIVLQNWQAFILCCIFGWVDRTTGKRRFREADIFVPRKNGKSALSAGTGIFMLAFDGEYGPEIYCNATTEKQAWEVFEPARYMVSNTPELKVAKKLSVNAQTITAPEVAGKFLPVIGKPGDGSSPSMAIIDEYHEHTTPAALDTMQTGMGAREQPLLWVITTAGDNTAGPCYSKQTILQDILSGALKDDTVFGIIYTVDPEDDWTDPAVLRKANPNMDVSVDGEFLRSQQQKAITNPRDQARFKTKHLNIWVNSRDAFFNGESWRKCPAAPKLEELLGRRCRVAIDLASKTDIAAMEILFDISDLAGEGHYARYGKIYLPSSTIDDPKNAHYRQWREAGYLAETDGNIIDFRQVEDDILALCEDFQVADVSYDPFQATYIATRLMERRAPMTEYKMTVATMSDPMKTLDSWILAGRLHHNCGDDHPLTWQIGNVTARRDHKDNVYPNKESEEKKIDSPVALIMCVGRETTDLTPSGSVYENRGLLLL